MDSKLEDDANWLWEFNGEEWGFDPRKVRSNPIENFSIPAETITTIVTAHHWKCVRLKRDRLIVVTDIWALSDRSPSAAQLAYRQALRDITTQSDPDDITWPVKPS